jgi:hypothetical protein
MHFLHILCLNEYNFSILSSKFCSDSISKRNMIIIYVSIRSRNKTLRFIQAALCTKKKLIQQRFIFQICEGKKEQIIRFFVIKNKKTNCFHSQKWIVDITIPKGPFLETKLEGAILFAGAIHTYCVEIPYYLWKWCIKVDFSQKSYPQPYLKLAGFEGTLDI